MAAAAITEQCCDIGRGKVYWVPRSTFRTVGRKPQVKEWYQVPQLVYVDELWSGKQQAEWMSLNHEG
jgi:hypothetical protein